MDTPGKGPPRPVIVPVMVHAAAAGGACWAPRPTLATTTAIAAPRTAFVDILAMTLLPLRVVRRSVRVPIADDKDKTVSEAGRRAFLRSLYVYLTLEARPAAGFGQLPSNTPPAGVIIIAPWSGFSRKGVSMSRR